MIHSNHVLTLLFASVAAAAAPGPVPAAELDSQPYRDAARRFADRVLADGRDRYGEPSPLFVDGLHAESLEPARWQKDGETWVLSNLASQQPLMRTLDGLTALTGDPQYRRAAEEATRYALAHLRTTTGLLCWGGHMAWDLQQGKQVGQYADVHEMKNHQPYYELMWRVDPAATARLLEMIWAGHIVDWQLLDYNRHASGRKGDGPRWDQPFREQIEVPFPTSGSNLSFANVTPSLLHAGTVLAVRGEHQQALTWTRRLMFRWQQARDPQTGLSGGQLSYRQQDRAQQALGHVHPEINEARIVATYHQTSRYHLLPLAQLQAAERLIADGGRLADVGREFQQWACDDLKTYFRRCYDPASGDFPSRMTDGTLIRWQEAHRGYYIPESFAPIAPDGFLLWGYCLGYRLSGDQELWPAIRELAGRLRLGELGGPDGGERKLCLDTPQDDWRLIYALLELHQARGEEAWLRLASRVADNLLARQTSTGLFPQSGRQYARTGDEIPLALLHLAGTLDGRREDLPRAIFDRRFFHCEFHGPLEPHQQKRDDARTYDGYVFYGDQ